MILRPLKSILVLTVLALPGLLPAQSDISSNEEERLQKLMADSARWYVPRTTVSIGFRVLSSGGKVHFGNLGSVAYDSTIAPISSGAVARFYDNGVVQIDAPRSSEKDANGNVTSTPGARYPTYATVTDANGNSVTQQSGDFLAYTPGLSRNWSYDTASQVTADGHVGMSIYKATSEGAGFTKQTGASAGVEFQYVYSFSTPAKRLQWGLLAGATLNGIHSKSVGSVRATLNTQTDYYSLAGGAPVPPAPYTTATAFTDYTGANGTVYINGRETTVPINAVPDSHTETSTPGGAIINGRWAIKGAYFMVRLGPSVRAQLTPRLGLSASLGIAGAYAGTTYSVTETFQVPDLPGTLVGATVGPNGNGIEQTTESKFLGGYYADFNLDWAANERTGLFGGLTAQKLGGYDQSVGSRLAHVDLGNAVGIRGGVSIRF